MNEAGVKILDSAHIMNQHTDQGKIKWITRNSEERTKFISESKALSYDHKTFVSKR